MFLSRPAGRGLRDASWIAHPRAGGKRTRAEWRFVCHWADSHSSIVWLSSSLFGPLSLLLPMNVVSQWVGSADAGTWAA